MSGEYSLDRDELNFLFELVAQKKLTIEQVCNKYNFSRATLYRRIKDNKFPKPHKEHGGKKYFLLSEIEKYLNADK